MTQISDDGGDDTLDELDNGLTDEDNVQYIKKKISELVTMPTYSLLNCMKDDEKDDKQVFAGSGDLAVLSEEIKHKTLSSKIR